MFVLDIFMGIVNDEVMVVVGWSKMLSEVFGAFGAFASCFAIKSSGVFECVVVDVILRCVFVVVFVCGFELVVVEVWVGV